MRECGKKGIRLIGILLAATAALWLLVAVGNLQQSRNRYEQAQLEEALRRAAVACYAAEGIYPPNLDYLVKHYGVQIDETRYLVVYDAFAQNLMPDITVLEKP